MKFLETKDLACNRDISLNLQTAQITYIESIAPKISMIHFANGGVVKVPLSRTALVSALESANDPGPAAVTSVTSIGTAETLRRAANDSTVSSVANPFMIGNEATDRRKTPDRRSTTPLETPPKKPDKEKDKSKNEDGK